jgi:hypothetical protein
MPVAIRDRDIIAKAQDLDANGYGEINSPLKFADVGSALVPPSHIRSFTSAQFKRF